jgi:hypothetical protein
MEKLGPYMARIYEEWKNLALTLIEISVVTAAVMIMNDLDPALLEMTPAESADANRALEDSLVRQYPERLVVHQAGSGLAGIEATQRSINEKLGIMELPEEPS